MIRTRVGYAGGTKKSPTYHSLGDHTETLEIDFDPAKISYEDLLEVFWKNHNPVGAPWSRQYMSLILYRNEAQEKAAMESRDSRQRALRNEVHTEVRPLKTFYFAESYHQKYRLQNHRLLMDEIRNAYPNGTDFVDSTVAARLNGYIAGYGNSRQLSREMKSLGLSEKGREELLRLVR